MRPLHRHLLAAIIIMLVMAGSVATERALTLAATTVDDAPSTGARGQSTLLDIVRTRHIGTDSVSRPQYPKESSTCKALRRKADGLLTQRRTCQEDSDCTTFTRKCLPFIACQVPVNRESIKEAKRAIAEYILRCHMLEPGTHCEPCPRTSPRCVSSQCVIPGEEIPGMDMYEEQYLSKETIEEESPESSTEDGQQSSGFRPEDFRCESFFRDERVIRACASCGDQLCQSYETCTPSVCTQGMCATNCGPLYCQVDCGDQPTPVPISGE
jgi:hypothetical protein